MRSKLFPRAAGLWFVALTLFAIEFAIAAVLVPESANEGLRILCKWDCAWYRSIVEQGYDRSPDPATLQANFAFFPAFPLAVRGIMVVTGLDFAHAGLLLNAGYLLAFIWLVLSSREELYLRSDRDATIVILAFIFTPWSLYNRVPYTEMQFNLALLATFVAWRRGHFVAAAILGVLLSATRVTGVFLPMALLLELALRERGRVLNLLGAPDGRFRAIAIMPLGGLAFFVFLAFHLGDPLASFRVQPLGWDHGLRNPVEILVGAMASQSYTGISAALAFGITCMALAAGAICKRVPVPLALVGLAIVCTSIVSGPHSMARFAWAIFPVYLVVPALPVFIRWPLLLLLAALQVAIVVLWFIPGQGLA